MKEVQLKWMKGRFSDIDKDNFIPRAMLLSSGLAAAQNPRRHNIFSHALKPDKL